MSSSESDPLLSRNPSVGSNSRAGEYSSYDISTPRLELPTSFQLFDISEDNKFLALIDNNFMLQAYELNVFESGKQIKRQTMKDIPCKIDCKNPICVYISVASETGHVALSFLQMDESGKALKKSSQFDKFTKFKVYPKKGKEKEQEKQFFNEEQKKTLDKNYATCRIYQENKNSILEISFQGRAVFTKYGLVLVDRWTLDVYNAKELQKMYSFESGSFYLDNCVGYFFFPQQNWNREYLLQVDGNIGSAGNGLACISAHIQKGVIVVYEAIDAFDGLRTSVKIWSILAGSLICSFTGTSREYVISVSEDHRFLVTNGDKHGALNIYCMKSGTQLHRYYPQGDFDVIIDRTVMLVKPISNQKYMIIGTVLKFNEEKEESEELDVLEYLYFEIFSIEQQTRVKEIQTSTVIGPDSLLALGILQNEDFLNTPSQFHGVFWETTLEDDRYLNFRTIQNNFYPRNPTSNGLIQNRLWGSYKYIYIGTEDEGGFTRDIFTARQFFSSDKTILYLLENDINQYILLVSPYLVQLWKLGDNDGKGTYSKNNTLLFNNVPQKKNGCLDFSKSTLIFARSYHGLNYKESTNGDILELMLEDENQYCRPHVRFLEDEKHIFVNVESKSGSSISEEIFLDNKPEDAFYGIESCLLALLYMYWTVDNNCGIYDMSGKCISQWTEILLTPMVSSNENTTYFQTRSASKILMRLAYLDKGLDIIKSIVLVKGFSVAIHNFTIDDNENLLTVLIQRRKFDLFQILFNQVIINYYNGDSVDLFPLMDALLCLHKNRLTELLLECIDNLSYLPVNLSIEGLRKSELQTLGDQQSFKNFTTFHQMKKRNPSILLFYVDKIMSLIRSEKKEIELVPTYYTENYFVSNQLCLIPLPNPRIYDAISSSILSKNSPYSRINALNEASRQESPVIEVVLAHRWKSHMKGLFYFLQLIHIVYYMFYTVAISFPEEIFGYNPGSSIQSHSHLICLVIVLLMWSLFLLEEVKQMITLKWKYWTSAYNYIDILALIFPLVTFILLITDGPHLYNISSLTTLMLWLHFILRLRANRKMGILIEIIIQLGVKIAPIIGLMILIIIAFTHSFAVLLRRQDDSFFQEQFQGNVAIKNGGGLGQNIAMSDQSQQNIFKDAFLAFSTVWFFLYGIFDPILSGDVGNYPMALVLAILFSFITALVILNVVIALMTGAIDETEKKGNRNWHIHLADVSNEVENLLGQFVEKDATSYVYYHASNEDIESHHGKIKNETKKLKEKLMKKKRVSKEQD